MNRINKEYEILTNDPIENVEFFKTDQFNKWTFTINGIKDSPYEHVIYKGEIQFPENYPFSPPTIKFISNVYHPNVYIDGKICLSYLMSQPDEFGYYDQNTIWVPVLSIKHVFIGLLSLFHTPNLESSANLDASIVWRKYYSTDINTLKAIILEKNI